MPPYGSTGAELPKSGGFCPRGQVESTGDEAHLLRIGSMEQSSSSRSQMGASLPVPPASPGGSHLSLLMMKRQRVRHRAVATIAAARPVPGGPDGENQSRSAAHCCSFEADKKGPPDRTIGGTGCVPRECDPNAAVSEATSVGPALVLPAFCSLADLAGQADRVARCPLARR